MIASLARYILLALLIPYVLPVGHVSQIGPGADQHINDCGAAALVMLLDAYDGEAPAIDELYDQMAPAGDYPLSLFWAMEPALDAAGLPATAYQFTTAAKMGQLLDQRRPFIAWVWSNHYVVVVGMDSGRVWVQDPLLGDGPSVWTQAGFDAALGQRRVILAPDAGLPTPVVPEIVQ